MTMLKDKKGRRVLVREHYRNIGGNGCCAIGLIPTSLIFLPFMLLYHNKDALLSIIDFHGRKTSPVLNRLHFRCRFTPSCSEYSRESIEKLGVVKGGLISLWRILKCNPFNKNLK